jgi:hypothetical protein
MSATASTHSNGQPSPSYPLPVSPSQPLSPRDSALLSALIRTNFDLAAVAFDHGLSLEDLCNWLESPAIQQLAATLLRSVHTFLDIRIARARMAVVGVLESIALSSDDPRERRRAAASLFYRPPRKPAPPSASSPRLRGEDRSDAPASEQVRGGTPESPSNLDARASNRDRSIATISTNGASALRRNSQPPSTSIGSPPSPSHPTTVSPPQPSPAHPPSSPAHPSPFPLANLLFHAFTDRDLDALDRAFHNHAAPDATLDGRPLHPTLNAHLLSQMHVSREVTCTQQSRSATEATYSLTFLRDPLKPARAVFSFVFTFSAGRWLISEIHTLDTS